MHFRSLIVLVVTLALSGCETLSDATAAVREKFAERSVPQTKSFSAGQREVFDALKMAAERMGYRFVRGGPATGTFEAISGVRAGDQVGSARQLALHVKLERALDGGTSAAVRITEIIEADSSNRAGLATEAPLRDTPQYEVFFHEVEAVLKRGGR